VPIVHKVYNEIVKKTLKLLINWRMVYCTLCQCQFI